MRNINTYLSRPSPHLLHISKTDAGTTSAAAVKYSAKIVQLTEALASYNSAFRRLLHSSTALRTTGLQRAVAPTLPLAMYPLNIALSPPEKAPPRHSGDDGRTDSGRSSANGGQGWWSDGAVKSAGKLPQRVREEAFLCVAAAIEGSGPLFVKVHRLIYQPFVNCFYKKLVLPQPQAPVKNGTSGPGIRGDRFGSVNILVYSIMQFVFSFKRGRASAVMNPRCVLC